MKYSSKTPSRDIVFMHRPLQEFMYAYNVQEIYGVKEQAINCQAVNSGLFTELLANKKTIWLSSGGDPNNDWMTIYHGHYLSTSRKSGTAGPGDLARGARIFGFAQTGVDTIKVTSWSIDGNGVHNPGHEVLYPPAFSFGYQM